MLRIGIGIIVKSLLKLRYRVEIEGLDAIRREKGKALVILPNHPAGIDPVILTAFTYSRFKARPLVHERFYKIKGFAWLMRLIKCVPIPDLKSNPCSWNLYKTERQMRVVLSLCEKKEPFLIYPAGTAKITGTERLGASAIVYELVQSGIPIQFVFARITGLWGSSFSRYKDGSLPDFNKTLIKGGLACLANLLFFLPRRRVLIELEEKEQADLKRFDKSALNRYMEGWFNRYPKDHGISESEPISLVPYLFFWRFKQRIFKAKKNKVRLSKVPIEIQKEIDAFLLSLTEKKTVDWTIESELGKHLNLDSLQLAELWIFLSKKYDLPGLSAEELITVGDIYNLILSSKHPPKKEGHKKSKKLWQYTPDLGPEYDSNATTLLGVFFAAAKKRKSQKISSDGVSGVLSYRKWIYAVYLLSREIKSRSFGEDKGRIAILLPSSAGAYVTILATLLAKRVPVMLNWTLGKRHLEECLKRGGFKTILSSERFLLELTHADLGSICSSIVLLEDLKKRITFGKKLNLLLRGPFKAFEKAIKNANPSSSDNAVLLFTSGTEGPPKMVPLTHENLVSNQRSGIHRINLRQEDIFYAMLPPFHSFGFSVTGLMPLLSGLRVIYEPNPTKSPKIVQDILNEKPTIICSPPSFMRPILTELIPHKKELSLRLVVSGAEAMPRDFFDLAKGFSFDLVEGYGITECSPVVSIQPLNEKVSSFEEFCKKGIGKPLGGIEIAIISRDSLEELKEGEEGEICICGKSVFSGYIGQGQETCFIQIRGKQFYRSGDRGKLQRGTLFLTGRYKRFVKIGGEMIHLGAIEALLLEIVKDLKLSKEPLELPPLAIIGIEGPEHKTQIYLYTIFELEKADLQAELQRRGLSPLFKIDQVIQVPSIPLTGTGKIDYLYLEKLPKSK